MDIVLVIVAQIIIAIYFYWAYYRSSASINAPPIYKGLLPWLGCAIEFGKKPLAFMKEKQRELGDVFTLYMTGRRLTFIMNPEDSKVFFSTQLDFQQAVQEPVQKTGTISPSAFFNNHTRVHDAMKGYLAQHNLTVHDLYHTLAVSFKKHLDILPHSSEDSDLLSLVRSTMYKSVINNLFGDHYICVDDQKQYEEFVHHFQIFDDDFEYGSQLPSFMLKKWMFSRDWLLKSFREAVTSATTTKTLAADKQSLFQYLLQQLDSDCAHKFSMLMLWASLANAIPITFWTLAFLLENKEELQKVIDEINTRIPADCVDESEMLDSESLRAMNHVRHAMLEAIRLRSPGVITRKATKAVAIKNYTIPAGDLVMISPYWVHRNEERFPQPHKFIPGRWAELERESGHATAVEGFIAFGGGRYQCPGRWFALMEIQVFVILILRRFKFELISKVPDPSTLHVVGTQQPDGVCRVRYTHTTATQ